jgi:hypothetical protein
MGGSIILDVAGSECGIPLKQYGLTGRLRHGEVFNSVRHDYVLSVIADHVPAFGVA